MNINIAFSCNDSYISHTGISMISLFENNKNIDSITIFFIEKDVSITNLDILKNICNKYNRILKILSFDKLCEGLVTSDTGRHIETVYAKLFLSRIIDIDKIFYIDSDTIINNSLKDLWSIDISKHCLAGVETYTVNSKEKLGLKPDDVFINDGVTLLNLEKLRVDNYDKKFIDYINIKNGNPILLSEGTINVVCNKLILTLHPKYNLMSGLVFFKSNKYFKHYKYLGSYYSNQIIKEAIEKPVVVHYLSGFYNRPWDINCTHPMKDLYIYYKSISPWKEVALTDGKISLYLRLIKFIIKYFPKFFYIQISKLKYKINK